MKKHFSKTAWDYLKRIAEFSGRDVALKTAKQCLLDTDGKYITFLQVLKSYRKIFPL